MNLGFRQERLVSKLGCIYDIDEGKGPNHTKRDGFSYD